MKNYDNVFLNTEKIFFGIFVIGDILSVVIVLCGAWWHLISVLICSVMAVAQFEEIKKSIKKNANV